MLVNLIEANLSANAIKIMEDMEFLTKLRMLNLSSNRISVIQGIANLKSLEEL